MSEPMMSSYIFQLERIEPKHVDWLRQKQVRPVCCDADCVCDSEDILDSDGKVMRKQLYGHNFNMEYDYEKRTVTVYDTGEYEDMDIIADIFKQFLIRFVEFEFISFEIAFHCSEPVPDMFGGAAYFITKDAVKYMSTNIWITQQEEAFCMADA